MSRLEGATAETVRPVTSRDAASTSLQVPPLRRGGLGSSVPPCTERKWPQMRSAVSSSVSKACTVALSRKLFRARLSRAARAADGQTDLPLPSVDSPPDYGLPEADAPLAVASDRHRAESVAFEGGRGIRRRCRVGGGRDPRGKLDRELGIRNVWRLTLPRRCQHRPTERLSGGEILPPPRFAPHSFPHMLPRSIALHRFTGPGQRARSALYFAGEHSCARSRRPRVSATGPFARHAVAPTNECQR